MKSIESVLIHETTAVNSRPGFYNISPVHTKLILNEFEILKDKNK